MKTYRVLIHVEEEDLNTNTKLTIEEPYRLGRDCDTKEEAERLFYHLIEFVDFIEDTKDTLKEELSAEIYEDMMLEENIHPES